MDFLTTFGFVTMWFIFGLIGLVVVIVSAGLVKEHTQNEGTATGWQVAGRYCCTTMEYSGHRFDANGFVESGAGENMSGIYRFMFRLAGWIFYFAGLVKPTRYLDYNDDDGFGKENYVFLHELLRQISLTKAETSETRAGSGAVAPDVTAIFRMRVVNVYKFLYVAPKDVVGQTMKVMETIVRSLVRNHTSDEVMNMDAAAIWKEISLKGCSSCADIDDKRTSWGIEIIPQSLAIRSVGYGEKFQEALEAKKTQELLADGETARIFNPVVSAKDKGISEELAVRLRSQALAGDDFIKVDVSTEGQAIKDSNLAALLGGGGALAQLLRKGNQSNQPKRDKNDKGGKKDAKSNE